MTTPSTLSANGRSSSEVCTSTLYQIICDGTFGGGTITPQIKTASGNWITYGTATLTASGAIVVNVRYGNEIAVNLSGATTPSIVVSIHAIS